MHKNHFLNLFIVSFFRFTFNLKLLKSLTLAFLLANIVVIPELGNAQNLTKTEKDFSYQMKIPGVDALSSSYLHLYALSSVEGLAVGSIVTGGEK